MSSFAVVPSITTHSRRGSTWRDKILEIEPLRLQHVGLFVTGLNGTERKECYRLLREVKKHHDFSIPFVHAVSDMDDAEYSFLRGEFGTRWFNLHPLREFPLLQTLSDETRSFITIENSCFVDVIRREDLDGFAGLCIDISHLEDARLVNPTGFHKILDLCFEFPVRANHISASIRPSSQVHRGFPQHSAHNATSDRDLEYLRAMPREVLGDVAALELENPLRDQLQLIQSVHDTLESLRPGPRKLAA